MCKLEIKTVGVKEEKESQYPAISEDKICQNCYRAKKKINDEK